MTYYYIIRRANLVEWLLATKSYQYKNTSAVGYSFFKQGSINLAGRLRDTDKDGRSRGKLQELL